MKKNLSLLIISLLAFAWGQFLQATWFRQPNLEKMAQEVQDYVIIPETHLYKLFHDEKDMALLFQDKYEEERLDYFYELPFTTLAYKNDSLLFWNNSRVAPLLPLEQYEEGSSYVHLKNGGYIMVKRTMPNTPDFGEGSVLIGLIPITLEYDIVNKYLKNGIDENIPYYQYIRILDAPSDGCLEIIDRNGQTLFYLVLEDYLATVNAWSIGAYLVGILFLILYINYITSYIVTHRHPLKGLAVFVGAIIAIYVLLVEANYPIDLREFGLFNPKIYASSVFAASLGELLVSLILIFWAIIFIYRTMPVPKQIKLPYWLCLILISVIWYGLFLGGDLVVRIMGSLVIDSRIIFKASELLNFDDYSIIGFVTISLLVLSLLLMVIKVVQYTNAYATPKYVHFAAFCCALMLYQLFYVIIEQPFPVTIAISLGGLILLLNFLRETVKPITSFTKFVFLLIYIAAFGAYWLYDLNLFKEEEQKVLYADRLAVDKDPRTEYYFKDIAFRIKTDKFVKRYFKNPLIPKNELEDRLKYLYFGGYFNRYDIQVQSFNAEGKMIKDANATSLASFLRHVSYDEVRDSRGLYFIPNSKVGYNYFSVLPVRLNGRLVGRVLVKLIPKIVSKKNVYPELLLEEKVKPVKEFEKYDYAIYKDRKLIRKSDNYPYRDSLTVEMSEHEIDMFQDGYDHLFLSYGVDKVIVVTSKMEGMFGMISLFSIIFCFLTLILFVIFPLDIMVRNIIVHRTFRFVQLSFGDRIHFSVVFVLVFSFLMIASVSLIYFNLQYEDYHRDRLLRKGRSIQTELEYFLRSKEDKGWRGSNLIHQKAELSHHLAEVVEIHGLDVNLYNLQGELIISSQPEIFDKGLVTRKLEPEALFYLSEKKVSRFLQDEHIGELNYLAAYEPVRSTTGAPMVWLNIPYFTREKVLKSEITPFLVALINVYVVLLLVAGFLALFISRSIIHSLSAIGEKFTKIRLGQKNEPIEWHAKDEIGILVDEYNKMLSELERSAKLLARSERESAWREMAKQVAHEIKNPLTPMKLSIQHLQRAHKENHPKLNEMTEKVTATLIEQIDALSNIATEFSSFAKMPTAKNEYFNMTEVVLTALDTFKRTDQAEVVRLFDDTEYEVFSDKNQILRVFNNLVQNALQALPEEREGRIEVDMKPLDGKIIVTVKDNGIGIPEEQKEKVFVPNFTTKSSGTGLGLAMSKNIIDSSRGRIWFESEVGVGTTFYVALPYRAPQST